jgi:hypothetical protein
MDKQLLFYERAVPVSKERHADWSVETGKDYTFARHVNAVPLLAAEFASAAAEYAIVFTGKDDAIMPAVLLGVRNDENVYLTEDGGWQAKYIPAFVRRYPFVFSSSGDGQTFTLCLDEEFAGCNREGRGQPLFSDEKEAAPYLERMLTFTKNFQAQYGPTAGFCKKLANLDLLDPMKARMKSSAGKEMSLGGFMAVNRDRLKELPGEIVSELVKTNELELIHTHLLSMKNFSIMGERMAAKEQVAKDEASDETAPLV